MPTPYDLMTEQLEGPDPEDQLQMQLGQDQGANLAGGPQAQPNGGGGQAPGAQPVPASPNVPGPLAALASKPAKPHIKLKAKPQQPKPKVKLKIRLKPHIKLKAMADV